MKIVFTENKDNYKIEAERLQSLEELSNGLWLVLAGINEIPPHIALVNDGKYYSVSARKAEVGEPVEKFLKAISRKTLPTVFIRIKSEFPPSEGLREAFGKYVALGNSEATCLWPVRDFFTAALGEEFSKCSFVFELLALAQKEDMLQDCKVMFAEGNISEPVLPKYTLEQIHDRINSIIKVNE